MPVVRHQQMTRRFSIVRALTWVYALATLATVAVLWRERDNRGIATDHAWGHAVVVLVLAVVMVAGARRASHGSRRALRRLRIISVVIPVVSLVIVAIPEFLPVWMRVEQGVYGALLLVIAVLTRADPISLRSRDA